MSAATPPTSVLLVDDDPSVLAITAALLRKGGFELTAIDSAVTAIATVEGGFRPDVLLCDVGLPEMTGMALADAVCTLSPATIVLFMSGDASPVLSRGVQAQVIAKPFRGADLVIAVRDAIAAAGDTPAA